MIGAVLAKTVLPTAQSALSGVMEGVIAAPDAPHNGTRFDALVDAANRLPRPALAFGTIAFFAYAMVNPAGFATRMQGLRAIPEPLWWLLGAVVGFHFGAREAFHFRKQPEKPPSP